MDEIKGRIRSAQFIAAFAVNRELIELYWSIGRDIVQRREGWGEKMIDRLAADLRSEFPEMSGLARTNVYRMRAFYPAYEPEGEIVPHDVIQWIESDLFARQRKSVTNFHRTLPAPQSDLAQQLLQDPYNFDFLTIANDAQEREAEAGLIAHIRQFLLELGVGFAFVGQQHPFEVGGEEFVIDLKMPDTNDFRVRIGHRRACPGGAMTGQLPTPNVLDSQLSVGLVPTEATTAKRLSHSLRWDKGHPKRGNQTRYRSRSFRFSPVTLRRSF